MKKNIFLIATKGLGALCLSLGLAMTVGSCSENIDESNYAIKTEKTMADYLSDEADLSDIKSIFDRVRLGSQDDASSLTAALSARGNYTVFAPTNDALRAYCNKLIGTEDVNALTYEQARLVAYNCIIDNGDDSAYETPDFPVKGTFNLPNLNDRQLDCLQDTAQTGSPYVINGTSKVIKENIEVSNGVLHEVDAVIALSSLTVGEIIASAPNMKIMGLLLNRTAWVDSLMVERDVDYENEEHEETLSRNVAAVYRDFIIPQKRYLGFTGFVEPDDIYERDWGIKVDTASDGSVTNADEVIQKIMDKVSAVYGETDKDDLTSPDNAINRFVAYHFIRGRLSYNHMVTHYNEYGYKYGADPKNPQSLTYSIDVWDYYPTVGQYPDLLKVTQVPTGEHDLFLNRVSKYNDAFDGDYTEVSTIAYTAGTGINVRINPDNGAYDNNALNGYYFPIDGILLKNKAVEDALGGERIRFDITSIFPEIFSNNIKNADYHHFPEGYLDAIPAANQSSGTRLLYLSASWGGGTSWTDYQGDEFMVAGLFDFVMRLPPVPKDGYYEIRAGISQNPLRGMAQCYIGEDPLHLRPTGLPLDLRQSVSPDDNPQLNWQGGQNDSQLDSETRVENDKNLRNQGYMRAPMYFTASNGQGEATSMARYLPNGYSYCCVRRIIGVERLEANKTYYLRFKSALKKLDAQFFLDYFEFCPTIVYNGTSAENPW